MAQEQYIYAVTRVHNNEQTLLTAQDVERLVEAKDAAEVFALLANKGWGSPDLPPGNPEALVAFEMDRTWSFVGELSGDVSLFNVFRLANDYHNLKAAIKLAYTANSSAENEAYFLKHGTIEVATIVAAAAEHNFATLPDAMAAAGKEAYEVLAHTSNGQLCDIVIDRATLLAIDAAGKKSTSKLLQQYATLTVDVANIKAAVRCCAMQKKPEFIERVLAPVGSLNVPALAAAAAQNMAAIYAVLHGTAYQNAIEELKTSLAAFERWCDDELIELIRPQKNNLFTIEPLAAYVLARENEINLVRLVFSAKINGLPAQTLRERLRKTYV
ncbi:V-type ATPase subunit [Ruminococcaceae bacterium OttesenSCG-928-A16]|nr:V-type ATPase subunit [Ruminococcaceae bacterium OttesenSCG-928-A16]